MLRKNTLHAWVGGDPFAPGAAPPTIRWAESLRGLVVLTFSRTTGPFADADARCAAGAQIAHALGPAAAFVAHPYAVTPFDDDYALHVDLVDKARERVEKARERAAAKPPRVRATGAFGHALAKTNMATGGRDADAVLEEVTLPSSTTPSWAKKGWFHAWVL